MFYLPAARDGLLLCLGTATSLKKDPRASSPTLQSSLKAGPLKEKAEAWQLDKALSFPETPPAIPLVTEFLGSFMISHVRQRGNPRRFSLQAQTWTQSRGPLSAWPGLLPPGSTDVVTGEDLVFGASWAWRPQRGCSDKAEAFLSCRRQNQARLHSQPISRLLSAASGWEPGFWGPHEYVCGRVIGPAYQRACQVTHIPAVPEGSRGNSGPRNAPLP